MEISFILKMKTTLAGIQGFGMVPVHDTKGLFLMFSVSSAAYTGTLFKKPRCVQCYVADSQVLIEVEKEASVD